MGLPLAARSPKRVLTKRSTTPSCGALAAQVQAWVVAQGPESRVPARAVERSVVLARVPPRVARPRVQAVARCCRCPSSQPRWQN